MVSGNDDPLWCSAHVLLYKGQLRILHAHTNSRAWLTIVLLISLAALV
jgi:hypothetical protein